MLHAKIVVPVIMLRASHNVRNVPHFEWVSHFVLLLDIGYVRPGSRPPPFARGACRCSGPTLPPIRCRFAKVSQHLHQVFADVGGLWDKMVAVDVR